LFLSSASALLFPIIIFLSTILLRSVYTKQHFLTSAVRHDKPNFARLPSDLNLEVKNCLPIDNWLHEVKYYRLC
jgi:hypothetical protein